MSKEFKAKVRSILDNALREIDDRRSNDPPYYTPTYNKDGSEKHVICDGARYHVISWHGTNSGTEEHCSEPNCEINREREARASQGPELTGVGE